MKKFYAAALPIIYLFLGGSNCAPEGGRANGFLLEPLAGIEAPLISPAKKYGIVITIFDRPDYVKKTFDSLKAANMDDSLVVIVDDASTDKEVVQLIKDFELTGTTIIKVRNRENSGVLTGLLLGFKLLEKNVQFLINVDNDVNVKVDWLEKLEQVYNAVGDKNIIVTGFNTSNHPIISCETTYCRKESLGGINFFMGVDFYSTYFKQWFAGKNIRDNFTWRNWDWTVVDQMKSHGFGFYATKPSVVQHIGYVGINAGAGRVDIAEDYDSE